MTQVNTDYPSGGVSGPVSSVTNNISVFAGTTGQVLKDNAGVVASAARLAAVTDFGIGVLTNRSGDFYIGRDAASPTAILDAAATTLAGILQFQRSEGTQAARTNIASGDGYGAINWRGWSGATGMWDTAMISAAVESAVTDNQRPSSAIQFFTNATNGAVTLNFNISSIGIAAAKGFGILGVGNGVDASITTASLSGKTITVTKGLITGFA